MTLYHYRARVERVVDGDTLDLSVDLGFGVSIRQRFRLADVDVWERTGKEREKGLAAMRDLTELLVSVREIRLETLKDKQGKYGRYLARIWAGDVLVNDWLKMRGHTK